MKFVVKIIYVDTAQVRSGREHAHWWLQLFGVPCY